MRIKRLTLAGFGPYKNRQEVDFEGYADDGIFLITGKTGAGKSSILDAICYALYAGVPRYEGTQQQLRSDHCEPDDPSFVELEFSVNDVDYRVRRTPEFDRPKQRGVGTTRQAATAELSQRIGDDWVGKSARAVDVGHDLDQILGLSKDQFLQVILLAQNRFQKFLRSNSDERQTVLRTLFGTKRFEQFETLLAERRKALEARLASDHAALRQYAQQVAGIMQQDPAPDIVGQDWFDAALTALTAELGAASASADTANAAAVTAELHFRQLTELQRLQQRRALATERLAALEGRAAGVDLDRNALATALRADAVWPHLQSRGSAEADLGRALTAEQTARQAYATVRADVEGASGTTLDIDAITANELRVDEIRADIDETTQQLGALADVLTDEKRLPALAADVASLAVTLRDHTERLATSATTIVELPARIDALNADLTQARIAASQVTSAESEVTRLRSARTAAEHAERLRADLTARETAERTASSAHLAAATALDHLLDRRLTGFAAEVAETLQDGEPCAVCGALDHPAPATRTEEAVTEADVRTARASVATAARAMDAAHAEVVAVATQLADAQARADGKPVAVLTDELAAVEDTLAGARAAHARATELEQQLVAIDAQLTAARAQSDKLTADRDVATHALASAEAVERSVEERVRGQRGDFASISERVHSLQRRVDAARRLETALASSQERRTALEVAETNLATQLEAQGFGDADAARTARRTPGDIATLQASIREFDEGVATAKATLADDEMRDLPAEPIAMGEAEATYASARDARDVALAARGALSERVTQLTAVVRQAHHQHEGTATLRAESEQLRELASAVQGQEPNTKRMRLETYVLAAQLEEIVHAANARLRAMTAGRFTLEHDDGLQFRKTQSGLGLRILDGHTGRSRATHSLSGGETFLASLALALGLAEVVTNQVGGITLDTLFIDEGFGSLDHDTLETAMSTLDGLRAGGRTIGLISHVDTMKEQIPAKLRIRVTDQGYSEIDESYELE